MGSQITTTAINTTHTDLTRDVACMLRGHDIRLNSLDRDHQRDTASELRYGNTHARHFNAVTDGGDELRVQVYTRHIENPHQSGLEAAQTVYVTGRDTPDVPMRLGGRLLMTEPGVPAERYEHTIYGVREGYGPRLFPLPSGETITLDIAPRTFTTAQLFVQPQRDSINISTNLLNGEANYWTVRGNREVPLSESDIPRRQLEVNARIHECLIGG